MEPNQGKAFSFITIGEDDQDEVIQAGIVEPEGSSVPFDDEPQTSEVQEADGTDEEFQEPGGPDEVEQPVVTKVEKPAKADSYQATTLEDLGSTPMPFAQKAVLILAALLIIAAVVYLNLK